MVSGYLDNAATTPMCDSAKQAFLNSFDNFGNPSSLHKIGVDASILLEKCRNEIADFIGSSKDEIIFTSGGTKSNNLAITGAVKALRRRGNRIVTTGIEHSSVLEPMRELENQGFEVVFLKPDKNGTVPKEQFENAINSDTILVSCMYINNETGAFLPINKIKKIIKDCSSPALLHCDGVQAFGKYSLDLKKNDIDLVSMSAHKVHGPKGVGALYIKKGTRILPIITGGGQEHGLYPGTEPVQAIASFAGAVSELSNLEIEAEKLKSFIKILKEKLCDSQNVVINSPENGSAYIFNISVIGYRSEILLHFLEERNIYVSSGSACSVGKSSHVLSEMGMDKKRVDSALRISFSRYNTEEDIIKFADALTEAEKCIIRRR